MKQLTFPQLIKLSKVLKKMGLKINLTDFLFGNRYNEMLKSMNCNLEDKQSMIFIQLAIFFVENIFLAEKEVYELMADLENKTIEEIKTYTIDQVYPIVINIFVGALPKNLNSIIALNVEHFKKKMNSMALNFNKTMEKIKEMDKQKTT